MSMVTIGVISIVALIVLFVIGVPVAYSMAIVGVIGFAYLVSTGASLSMLSIEVLDNFSSYNLTVIPTFVLMGAIAYSVGITGRLYDASYTIFGKMRGGLAIASIAACAGFAAICGSTSATAAAMGRVALPQMKRYGYDDALATGCIAAAGSLGILIPPSTIFIVYGIITEQSIGKLFIAGVIPGILLAGLFMVAVMVRCWQNPLLGPAGTFNNPHAEDQRAFRPRRNDSPVRSGHGRAVRRVVHPHPGWRGWRRRRPPYLHGPQDTFLAGPH